MTEPSVAEPVLTGSETSAPFPDQVRVRDPDVHQFDLGVSRDAFVLEAVFDSVVQGGDVPNDPEPFGR